MLAYGRQKPDYSHFVARIFRKILAKQSTRFIHKLLKKREQPCRVGEALTKEPPGNALVFP